MDYPKPSNPGLEDRLKVALTNIHAWSNYARLLRKAIKNEEELKALREGQELSAAWIKQRMERELTTQDDVCWGEAREEWHKTLFIKPNEQEEIWNLFEDQQKNAEIGRQIPPQQLG